MDSKSGHAFNYAKVSILSLFFQISMNAILKVFLMIIHILLITVTMMLTAPIPKARFIAHAKQDTPGMESSVMVR